MTKCLSLLILGGGNTNSSTEQTKSLSPAILTDPEPRPVVLPLVFFFFFLRFYLFIFREMGREEEKERNVDVQEIHCLIASRTPSPTKLGTWPPTRTCALTGN